MLCNLLLLALACAALLLGWAAEEMDDADNPRAPAWAGQGSQDPPEQGQANNGSTAREVFNIEPGAAG